MQNPMLEATRLTREGRLAEATALLQRALQGEAPAQSATARRRDAAFSGTGPPTRIVDIDTRTGEVLDPDGVTASSKSNGVEAYPWRAAASARKMAYLMPNALLGLTDPVEQVVDFHARKPQPDGGQFATRSFRIGAQSLGYKLYTPSRTTSALMPLVVMLHGCKQSPDDFAAGTRMNMLAEERGCVIAYPGQTRSANAQKCWNWFSTADQQRDQGEPAMIAGITRQIMHDHAVDGQRVYVAGLSAGGAAAAIMGMAYPDLYAAIGVHSGLACGAAHDIPSAFTAMRQGATEAHQARKDSSGNGGRRMVPTIVFHADRDGTVHPRNADQVLAQAGASDSLLLATHSDVVPGGHAYSRTIHSNTAGQTMLEQWVVHGGGHAWSGGSAEGSFTDPRGPDASREMLRFFLEHSLGRNA